MSLVTQNLFPELISVVGVNHLATTAGGRVVAASDTGMGLRLYADGELRWAVSVGSTNQKVASTQRVRSISFSGTGDRLFVAAADTVLCLDALTGETMWSYVPKRSFGFLVISPMCLDAQGTTVAAAFDNGGMAIWHEGGQLLRLWQDPFAPRHLAIASDGSIVGSDSFSISVWSQEGRRVASYRLPERIYGFSLSVATGEALVRSIHELFSLDLTTGETRNRIPVGAGLPLVETSLGGRCAIATRHEVILDPMGTPKTISVPSDRGFIVSIKFLQHRSELLVGTSDGSLLTLEF